jgi:hypothetical protein
LAPFSLPASVAVPPNLMVVGVAAIVRFFGSGFAPRAGAAMAARAVTAMASVRFM